MQLVTCSRSSGSKGRGGRRGNLPRLRWSPELGPTPVRPALRSAVYRIRSSVDVDRGCSTRSRRVLRQRSRDRAGRRPQLSRPLARASGLAAADGTRRARPPHRPRLAGGARPLARAGPAPCSAGPEGALLWAQYHHASGDPAHARQSAEQALAHASDPRQPLALIAAHRFLGHARHRRAAIQRSRRASAGVSTVGRGVCRTV